ncbi:MAG: hypothetical protein MHM6MM_001701 [Cercozoa sp. M6MM]
MFCVDRDLVYEPFFADFGPLNLGHLNRFIRRLDEKLSDPTLRERVLVLVTRNCGKSRANAAVLMGAYAVLRLGLTWQQAWHVLRPLHTGGLLTPFHDPTPGPCAFQLLVSHCLQAIELAGPRGLNWYDPSNFAEEQYDWLEKVENADLTVMVPNKVLAFSGPASAHRATESYYLHTPEHYVSMFKSMGVTDIIRLNRQCYESHEFTRHGFRFHDMFFFDGTCPPPQILREFLRIVERSKGVVAVHCKAGLGRTGTLIGCYMMKRFGWTAEQCIAWMRIVRPGSVIGPQQFYLQQQQPIMHELYQAVSKNKENGLQAQEIPTGDVTKAEAMHDEEELLSGEDKQQKERQSLKLQVQLPAHHAAARARSRSIGSRPSPDTPMSQTGFEADRSLCFIEGKAQGQALVEAKVRAQREHSTDASNTNSKSTSVSSRSDVERAANRMARMFSGITNRVSQWLPLWVRGESPGKRRRVQETPAVPDAIVRNMTPVYNIGDSRNDIQSDISADDDSGLDEASGALDSEDAEARGDTVAVRIVGHGNTDSNIDSNIDHDTVTDNYIVSDNNSSSSNIASSSNTDNNVDCHTDGNNTASCSERNNESETEGKFNEPRKVSVFGRESENLPLVEDALADDDTKKLEQLEAEAREVRRILGAWNSGNNSSLGGRTTSSESKGPADESRDASDMETLCDDKEKVEVVVQLGKKRPRPFQGLVHFSDSSDDSDDSAVSD